jgi:hypothetical protein
VRCWVVSRYKACYVGLSVGTGVRCWVASRYRCAKLGCQYVQGVNVRHCVHTNCGVLSAFSGPLSVLETSSDEIKELHFRIMEIFLYQSCTELLLSFEILLVSRTTRQHVPDTVRLRMYTLPTYLLTYLLIYLLTHSMVQSPS